MSKVLRPLLAVAALLLGAVAALAGERVALVIGNGRYEGTAPLTNPVNDARDVAQKLEALGFTVVSGFDLGKREMELKIGAFSDLIEGAEASLVYFAGHGVSDRGGRNFLVPVDGHLDAPGKLKFESIAIDDIAELMSQQTAVSILILDACRNNPFARAPQGTRGAADASAGLAAGNSYAGTYTIYSAQPGAVALDGTGRNSPFAAALLKHMATPGITVETMMGLVKTDVMAETNGFQEPDASGLLGKPFNLVTGAEVATRAIAAPDAAETPAVPGIAEQAQIRQFIESEYLDPDIVNLEATIARVYMPEANVFGTFANQQEILLLKKGFFDQFLRWELSLYPGTLEITFASEKKARAVFVLKYVYWPKAKPDTPAEGNFKAALDLVEQDGRWKIQSEAAVN